MITRKLSLVVGAEYQFGLKANTIMAKYSNNITSFYHHKEEYSLYGQLMSIEASGFKANDSDKIVNSEWFLVLLTLNATTDSTYVRIAMNDIDLTRSGRVR